MIASAYYSLTNYQIISAPEFIGLKNFVDLLNDKDFLTSLSVTVRYGLMYVALSQVVCIGLAVLLSQKVRGLTIFRTIFYLPIIVPFVASSLRACCHLISRTNKCCRRRWRNRRRGRPRQRTADRGA